MRTETCDSYSVTIFIAGPVSEIELACREACLQVGLCVTVTETSFVFTGGCETGAAIGIVNYPRFPAERDELWKRATELAIDLLAKTFQHSVLLQDATRAMWITKREQK